MHTNTFSMTYEQRLASIVSRSGHTQQLTTRSSRRIRTVRRRTGGERTYGLSPSKKGRRSGAEPRFRFVRIGRGWECSVRHHEDASTNASKPVREQGDGVRGVAVEVAGAVRIFDLRGVRSRPLRRWFGERGTGESMGISPPFWTSGPPRLRAPTHLIERN
jgi:hypothetical protein